MNSSNKIVAVAICFFAIFMTTSSVSAQSDKTENLGQYQVEGSQTYHLVSEQNDQTYAIFVQPPMGFKPAMCKQMATVYATDGNWFFSTLAFTATTLRFDNEIPPVLTVGIGYPDGSNSNTFKRRVADLVPVELDPSRINQMFPGGPPTSGEAKGFATFIRNQVIPFIETTYCATKARVYFGHSLGGTFGTYALLRHTDLFDRYIIGSPAYDQSLAVMYDYEKEFNSNHADMAKQVYFGVGTEDKYLLGTARMMTLIKNRKYPNLSLTFETFKGLGHNSIMVTMMSNSFRKVLSDLKLVNR